MKLSHSYCVQSEILFLRLRFVATRDPSDRLLGHPLSTLFTVYFAMLGLTAPQSFHNGQEARRGVLDKIKPHRFNGSKCLSVSFLSGDLNISVSELLVSSLLYCFSERVVSNGTDGCHWIQTPTHFHPPSVHILSFSLPLFISSS